MKKLLICSMLVGALAACGDDDGRDGPITLMDSGTSPGTDAGTTPTMDGGSTMTEDAGGGRKEYVGLVRMVAHSQREPSLRWMTSERLSTE